MALIATAPATSTGLHDDLGAIADFCSEHGIWLHVDAAHGGSALLSDRHRHRLAGIERADSVVWDAHKMLRTTALCAAVLVKRERDLPGAFRQQADYIFDGRDSLGVDLVDRALETTKSTLGLKLFLSLAWAGERGLADYVTSRYDLTRRFYEVLSDQSGISCPYVPESNILCFGVEGHDQLELRDRILADGRFHISSTTIAGERYLRVVITAPDTDETTIAVLLEALARATQQPSRPPAQPADQAAGSLATAQAPGPQSRPPQPR